MKDLTAYIENLLDLILCKIEQINTIQGDKLEYYKSVKSRFSSTTLCGIFCINPQILNEFELRWKTFVKSQDQSNLRDANALRLIITLEYLTKTMQLPVDRRFPTGNNQVDLSIKQVRVIELLLRDLLYDQVGTNEVLTKKLANFFGDEQINSWIKNADESGVLSGTSFSELTSIFIHQEIFMSLEAYFQRWSITYSQKIRETLRYAFEDIRIIRNQIAHNKAISFAQIELLNIYYVELKNLIEVHPEIKLNISNYLGDHSEDEQFLNRIREDRREYWFGFIQYLTDHNFQKDLTNMTPPAYHWMRITNGTIKVAGHSSPAVINVRANNNTKLISVELFILKDEEKKLINHLYELEFQNTTDAIDPEIAWEKQEGLKTSKIILRKEGDFLDQKSWEEQFSWLHKNTEQFISVFGKYLIA